MLKRNLIFFLLVLFFSCENKVLNENEGENKKAETKSDYSIEYYLDGVRIEEGRYKALDERYYNVISPQDPKNPDPKHVIINAFSSIDKYIEFGKSNGIPLDKAVNFERHIQDYAEKNGIIKIYEESGEIPESFIKYQESYYNQLFQRNGRGKKVPSVIYKDYVGGPGWVMSLSFMVVMPPGWNNTVSRYYYLGLYGAFIVFDKWLYRKHMATLWGWGWSYIHFLGPLSPLNDRMSSGISL